MSTKDEKKKIDEVIDLANEKALKAILKIKRLQAKQYKEQHFSGVNLDDPKHINVLVKSFMKENQQLFEAIAQRLIDWARAGNSLYIHWFSQNIIEIIRIANEQCRERLKAEEKDLHAKMN
ncbi:MAG TPA: hypothetical protein ENG51_14945 [Deltaproteobacteria bacterium]|nr:MAG: hypothetical protein B1H11_04670 [Desulfobacteraceae bacterium 4484_190.1]HDM77743.1 hypothetical protein [Deltaproteobacteria bacterium]